MHFLLLREDNKMDKRTFNGANRIDKPDFKPAESTPDAAELTTAS